MILDIYKDALEYSAKDWKTLVILGVMCFFSLLLLPIFLITGYNYRVIENAVHGIINGRDPLPGFEDLIAYLLVPCIAFIIFAILGSQLPGVAASASIVIGCLISFVLLVVACLMNQMGICHMAYNEGVFSKAFAIREIKEVIDDIGWFECIATYLGLIIITAVIAIVVTSIIYAIFTVFGISGALLGADMGGIFVLGALINSAITMFIVGPYLSIFNSRSIGLLYTMQI